MTYIIGEMYHSHELEDSVLLSIPPQIDPQIQHDPNQILFGVFLLKLTDSKIHMEWQRIYKMNKMGEITLPDFKS